MKIFRPTYIGEFACDGKACNSRCCRDWRIAVDEEAREKFLRLPVSDRTEIFCHIDESTQVFEMKNSGACPFLNENFLCKLQIKHGEDFLPAICQSFPRVTYKLDEKIFLQTMTLTCPVAANLILLREEPIIFETVDELKTRQIFDFTERISSAEKFLSRQQAAVKILQRRDLSINQRLKNLCEFFGEKISANFDEIKHATTLAEIFGEMYDATSTDVKKIQLVETYRAYRRNILSQLRGEFSIVMENYLVNEFVMRCYPYAFAGDEAFNCRVFVTVYRAVEFATVLATVARSCLTVEKFLNLLCALNDKFDHSRGSMEAIKNFAAQNVAEKFSSLMIE